tara:strand:- start:237 stop:1025 length:789 start_codon:yes stop_codon:yes gene_type:complete
MNKQINFLVGLPRAGNTLLSSILNQNSKIAVTANSVTNEIAKELIEIKTRDVYKNFPYEKPFNDVCNSVFSSYYKNWKQDYILDRGPWGYPNNLQFLKNHFDGELKFIVLVRNVSQVLQSFLKHSRENKNSFVNRFWAHTDEEKCDMLMNKEGLIMGELISIHHLTQLEHNKHMAHLIEYEDLINRPKEIIKDIYDFLNIPHFEHNFESFEQLEIDGHKYNDESVGDNLHTIKENGLSKTIHEPLSQSVLDKYGNLEFWRNK